MTGVTGDLVEEFTHFSGVRAFVAALSNSEMDIEEVWPVRRLETMEFGTLSTEQPRLTGLHELS